MYNFFIYQGFLITNWGNGPLHYLKYIILLKNLAGGLERWLRSIEYSLLLQRPWVQFLATTWLHTTIYNSISNESSTLF